ncbi:hypothetical protein HYU16_01685 [Candidatus Woesearchaeota archaeon]|nr:hypothetical protein [Candidatus Woesearchaeota archaeon]
MPREKDREKLSAESLNGQLSKAVAMMELYEKHANSAIRSEAELGHVQREMKIIRDEILSELAHSRKTLQALQQEVKELGLKG